MITRIVAQTERALSTLSGTDAWDAFVVLIDTTPDAQVEPHLDRLAELWLAATSEWSSAELQVKAPDPWLRRWLEGSGLHAALLDMVPYRANPQRSPLRRCSYYRLTYYEAYRHCESVKQVAFFTDTQAVVDALRSAAADRIRCVQEYGQDRLDDMGSRLPHTPKILDIFWRGEQVGKTRYSNAITVAQLEDDDFSRQLVPPLGARDRLPPRSRDPRFDRARAYLFYELPRDILDEVLREDGDWPLAPVDDIVPSADKLAYWDGQLHTGVYTPYELLTRMDNCDEYEAPPLAPIPLPADFEERYADVIRRVAVDVGLIPLNPSGEALECITKLSGPCVLPGFAVWDDDTYNALSTTPWNPAFALALGFQPFVVAGRPGQALPDPLPTVEAKSWWADDCMLAIRFTREDDQLTFEIFPGTLNGAPWGWSVGVAMAVCRRLRDAFRVG